MDENKIFSRNHIVEIFQVYSWNIYGESIYLVYTWYIPEKNFLGVPDVRPASESGTAAGKSLSAGALLHCRAIWIVAQATCQCDASVQVHGTSRVRLGVVYY
jgi:hypothetical protein